MADEEYNEEHDLIIPKNRRIVLMQSRQSGKCVAHNTELDVRFNNQNGFAEFKMNLNEKYSLRNYFKKLIKNLFS